MYLVVRRIERKLLLHVRAVLGEDGQQHDERQEAGPDLVAGLREEGTQVHQAAHAVVRRIQEKSLFRNQPEISTRNKASKAKTCCVP